MFFKIHGWALMISFGVCGSGKLCQLSSKRWMLSRGRGAGGEEHLARPSRSTIPPDQIRPTRSLAAPFPQRKSIVGRVSKKEGALKEGVMMMIGLDSHSSVRMSNEAMKSA